MTTPPDAVRRYTPDNLLREADSVVTKEENGKPMKAGYEDALVLAAIRLNTLLAQNAALTQEQDRLREAINLALIQARAGLRAAPHQHTGRNLEGDFSAVIAALAPVEAGKAEGESK